MKIPGLILLFFFAALAAIAQKSPEGFIENKGQVVDQDGNSNPSVLFLLNRPGMNVQLKKNSFSYDTWKVDFKKRKSTEIERERYLNQPEELEELLTYAVFRFHRVDIEFVGANPSPQIITGKSSSDLLNYYLNEKECTGIRHFSKITYKDLYPLIDLEFFIRSDAVPGEGNVEYQFIVHPGGNPRNIVMKYDGSNGTELKNGKIVIEVSNGIFTEKIPASFILGENTPVIVKYRSLEKDQYGFEANDYPRNKSLVIDPWPQLIWGTYYGGALYEKELGIVTDILENVYVCGNTLSTSNIATAGAHQVTKANGYDGYISKLDVFGQRVWGTYYGGNSNDYMEDITLDLTGNVYIAGSTFSASSITTAGSHQPTLTFGEDGFFVKFDNNGVRLWGSYYGGNAYDKCRVIKVAASGNIYIGGETVSTNFISTAGGFQPAPGSNADIFIAKFFSTGTRDWGTYYGGADSDFIHDGLVIDAAENIYITGRTNSTNAISTAGAFQATFGGGTFDALIAKITTLCTLEWATYYGGTAFDDGFDLTLNSTGDIYATGWTTSSDNISTTGAFQETFAGVQDGYLVKFSNNGTRIRGTYFGGAADDMFNAIGINPSGSVILSGSTKGTIGLATEYAHQTTFLGVEDVLLVKFDSLLQRTWCTYFGGTSGENSWDMCVTQNDYYYVCGDVNSTTGVGTPGTYQPSYGGGTQDGYIARFVECSMITANSFIMPLCYGDSTGSAIVTPSDGTPAYLYLWNDLQTTDTATGLAAGTYYVTVSDSRGCRWRDTVDITQPTLLSATLSGTDALCFGGSEGTVDATPAGGTPGYSYAWDSGCTDQTCDSLPAGTYNVTVYDANNCTITEQVTINEPTIIDININATDVSCHGGSNGIAQAIVTGGTPNPDYFYLWSNGDTIPNISGLDSSEYYVTVTDGNNCTMTDTILIGQPDTLLMTFTETPASCFGYNDGALDVSVSGGIAAYQYLWENADTTNVSDTLYSGTYLVTVTDANNCSVIGQSVVTEPPLLTSVFDLVIDVSCHAFSDGYISALPSGGTPSYSFAWSNGSDSSSAGNLIAGQYYLSLTDSHNCFYTDTVTINEPDTISVSFTNSTNLCFGDNTGTSSIFVSGGTIPYMVYWSNGNTGPLNDSLYAGTYTITVIDDHNCIFEDSTQVIQPDSIQIIFVADSVACNGGTSGVASAIILGGTIPFNYEWSTGSTNDTIFNLTAGTYPLTITDANSCIAVDSITIGEPTPIRLFVNYYNLTCFQSNDGSADASAIGGVPPYQFLWSTGYVGTEIDSLPAGNYGVTVYDSHGCTESLTFIITEPPLLESTGHSVDVICFGDPSGMAYISTNGGTEPYSYLWDNGYTQQVDSTIASGTYIITTTDAHGCTYVDTITVEQPDNLILTMTYNDVLCYNHANGWAQSTVTGGILPYDYLWNTGDSTASISNLVPGIYNLLVTDSNLCTASYSVTITQPDSLWFDYTSQNISCYEFDDAEITGNILGGTVPYMVSFTNENNQQVPFTDLAAGYYYLLITDLNACTFADTFLITQPDTLLPTADFGITSFDNYGYIDLTVTGGTEPYNYIWSNDAYLQDLTHLIGGTYVVTVTDDHGCTSVLSAFIDLTLTIPNVITPNEDGYNDDFEILDLEAFKTVQISIYNRWGNSMYYFDGTTQEYNNGNRFDGKHNGNSLPMGSYVYIVVLNEETSYNGALLIKY